MRDENMSYTVKSSERLRKSGSEAETKALLYLMNFRPDSDDIYYFVVDFFNDLTGHGQHGIPDCGCATKRRTSC